MPQVVWCGFGEPTVRLDLVLAASPRFRGEGAAVRLDTNGHGSLIHGRDILPERGAVVDRLNVSLNAPAAARYAELCRPDPEAVGLPGDTPAEAFRDAVLEVLERAPHHMAEVEASAVGHVLDGVEIEACRRLAAELAGVRLRVR